MLSNIIGFIASKFADKAIKNGCVFAIIDEKEYANSSNTILVDNVLVTLQELATLHRKKLNPYTCPGVIIAGHGPFTWGTENSSAVSNAEILEFVAQTTFQSFILKIKKKLPKYISRKHYQRKHGKKAYYGQN